MPKVAPFHSANEDRKPSTERVHHNDNNCPPARDIPATDRRRGTGQYPLCPDCRRTH